jgi:hypothetical protein
MVLSVMDWIIPYDFPPTFSTSQKSSKTNPENQWIGLRENLQETMVFTIR